jgi:triosephosphate isomerase
MAGNWKLNCDNDEARALACAVNEQAGDITGVEVVLCPPATALTTVVGCLEGSEMEVGAQNMFWEETGAFTGELSAKMILSTGAEWVIIGHSERRGRFGAIEDDFTEELQRVFGDCDAGVNLKLKAALAAGLRPIVCCGELLSEREAGKADEVVAEQVRAMLDGVCGCDIADEMVIAYEPVWAIGTGEVCGEEARAAMRVLYGGSVKPDNVVGLMAKENIDGGLVGGASLKADDFVPLIEAAKA